MAVTEVGWEQSKSFVPEAGYRTPYFRTSSDLPDGLVDGLMSLGRGNITALFGYGSSFVGSGNGKMKDFLAVVGNTWEFHQRNSQGEILHYGTTKNPLFHENLQRYGPNYYHGEIGGQKFKFVVIDLDRFGVFARGARRDSYLARKGAGYLYLPGRLSKLLTVIHPQDPEKVHPSVKQAINQAKTDCMWLALSLVPPIFSEEEWLTETLDLSYKGDFRVELNGKAKKLYQENQVEYAKSYQPHLDDFADRGVVTPLGGGIFRTEVRLKPSLVEGRLLAAKIAAIKRNYILTWATVGLDKGWFYAWDKVFRSVGLSQNGHPQTKDLQASHPYLLLEEGVDVFELAGEDGELEAVGYR
ncbi:hypothetical protein HYS93_02075 [Candidatus Daviesbacteria bacterium]|nr:hypothetical protein [Candidatus Daviesbacteria bacterium]